MSQSTDEIREIARRMHQKSMKLADWDHYDMSKLVRDLGRGFELIAEKLDEKEKIR